MKFSNTHKDKIKSLKRNLEKKMKFLDKFKMITKELLVKSKEFEELQSYKEIFEVLVVPFQSLKDEFNTVVKIVNESC